MLTCVDHKGKFYMSIADMTREYGIRADTYYWRRKRGWSLRNALCTPVAVIHQVSTTVQDHLGNEYRTIKDMLDAWGVTYSVYYGRLRKGWSLEQILTVPIMKRSLRISRG